MTPREEKLYLLASAKTNARSAEVLLREVHSDLKIALGEVPQECIAAIRAAMHLVDVCFSSVRRATGEK